VQPQDETDSVMVDRMAPLCLGQHTEAETASANPVARQAVLNNLHMRLGKTRFERFDAPQPTSSTRSPVHGAARSSSASDTGATACRAMQMRPPNPFFGHARHPVRLTDVAEASASVISTDIPHMTAPSDALANQPNCWFIPPATAPTRAVE
jgi:hypothetical protein